MPKKADTKKSTAKKTQAKKAAIKKAPAKKAPAKKAPLRKLLLRKLQPRRLLLEEAPAKKTASRKRSTPISSYKGRKGEKYMSAAMKKHFNAVLIEWREHLREEMQKTFDHLKNKG